MRRVPSLLTKPPKPIRQSTAVKLKLGGYFFLRHLIDNEAALEARLDMFLPGLITSGAAA